MLVTTSFRSTSFPFLSSVAIFRLSNLLLESDTRWLNGQGPVSIQRQDLTISTPFPPPLSLYCRMCSYSILVLLFMFVPFSCQTGHSVSLSSRLLVWLVIVRSSISPPSLALPNSLCSLFLFCRCWYSMINEGCFY